MNKTMKVVFVLISLYWLAHIAFWYQRHVVRQAQAETVSEVNELMASEHADRFFFRVHESGDVAMTYRRPSFKAVRIAAARAGDVE